MNGQNGYSIRGASNQVSYEPKKNQEITVFALYTEQLSIKYKFR